MVGSVSIDSKSMVIVSEVVCVKQRVEGKVSFYCVECCRDSQVTRLKRFRCGEKGFEDADARLKALRFGFFTEGLAEFRGFLFSEGFRGSSEGLGSNGGGRLFICARRSGSSGLCFAAVVVKFREGFVRGVSFAGEEEAAIQKALGFVRGKGFWNWVRQVRGSSSGACRHCGQQQQEENDTQFGKQISEDCICLDCKKMENSELTVIRMDDQGEYRTIPAEEIWADNRSAEVTSGKPFCTFCGCEDNDSLEEMISRCTCSGGSVVAHPSCFRAYQSVSRIGINQAPSSCKVCGGRGAAAIGVSGKISAGSTEDSSSKSVGLDLSLRSSSRSATPKKAVKQFSSDLTNGGTNTAEFYENQPSSKRLKGESGRKVVEDPQKLVVTPVRRFDDAAVSVPIKKRKFWPPSPSPESPKAPALLDLSFPDPPVSRVQSGSLSGAEEEQGPINAHREQQVLDGMDAAGKQFEDKSIQIVIDISNETRGKTPSSVVCFSEDTISNADLSGVSTSTIDTKMGELERNGLDDRVCRVGFLDLEDAKPVAVNLNDSDIGSRENPQQDCTYVDTQNQEEHNKHQGHVLESDLLPVSDNKSYVSKGTHVLESDLLPVSDNKSCVSKGIPACSRLSETEDNIACKEMNKATELALGRNSTSVSKNLSEIVGCSRVTSEVGECSQHKSAPLLNDGQKQEKGFLRLNSGYFDDDRSHWDLNAPMDSWEKQAEAVNRDPEPECTGKLPAGNACNENFKHLNGFQVDILISDAKHNSKKPEQDMLSKGLQAEQNDHAPNSSEGLGFVKDSVLDMSLSLQPDAMLSRQPTYSQIKLNHALGSKSFSLFEKPVTERDLNLSMAQSEAPFELEDGISSAEAQDVGHSVVIPSDISLEKETDLVIDKQEVTVMIDVNVDTCGRTEHSSPIKCELEPVEDGFEAGNIRSAKGILRCLSMNHESSDCEQKCSPSLPAEKQDPNETIHEDMTVNDTHTSAIFEADTVAENVDIPIEKLGSPEVGLDKKSPEYAKEIAYSGDYESDGYDDEDEPVSDTEKELVELAEDELQDEEGEYREMELHDWIEDVEELEDEHVDYGDSDFRDADDLGMEIDDKGKEVEHERSWDDRQKSEMDEKCYSHPETQDSQIRADGEDTKPETTAAGTGIEHNTEEEKYKADGIVSQSPELLIEEKVLEIEPDFYLDMNDDFPTPREVRLSVSSRQKSSGWDQLPEGYENAEEALKAVQDTISKRGRGSSWTTGGRLGPMCTRIPSRIDAGFRERMTADDSVHGKEAFFIRGRDGSLPSSPSFTSRKPTRGRTLGRGGPSRGIHHRGRADPWGDGTSNHWSSNRHHSPPDYYVNKAGFGSHASANAAAVSAAKVESSGFVVASDGTLTKIIRGGIRGRRGRGTLMGRGSAMDIDESLDFGMQMSMGPGGMMPDTGLNASRGRTISIVPDRIDSGRHVSRERYRGPSFGHSRWDHSLGDSPRRSMDHRLRERNSSFSPPPGRRLTRISRSHTQSRSRSHTRSPRLRSSPRGSVGAGMGRGPAIRRRSRSPSALRSEARIERPKSPLYHRVGSFEHKMSFLSSSRTQRSSPQSSKWSYDRRDTGRFKDSDYRRSFVRSGSPSRKFSPRGVHESGLTDSPGRLRHSEYRGSVYSSRTAELNSESRRFKHDENEDVKVKQTNISGRAAGEGSGMDVRRFRHQDSEGDCQPRSSCAKDAGISREQGIEDHNNRL